MNFLSHIALAMAPGGEGGATQSGGESLMSTLMLVVPMILIFYFFLIRPQTKRAKEHQGFLEGLKRGDKVVTNGGMWGKIAQVADGTIDLEVANNVKIRFSKSAISGYQAGDNQAAKS
jgi:preprotein translocase subunit YajC